ncbi:chaperonin 10-like protein [Aspergillus keveii]|uniref:Chaperonin 10-like protein n=1 Tax=Aspergillus keveii TaxID=714993 RepID=A0ABR4G340_9EURO
MTTNPAYSLPPPNHAALLTGLNARPLSIEETADRYPNENELVVRVHAVAINQIDWKMQDEPWTDFKYPLILGVDVAGEVVHVGSEVNHNTQAKGLHSLGVGDRVAGHALRLATGDNRHAAFQEYAVLWNNMTVKIPSGMSYERAAVLPLGVSTASAALFQQAPAGMGLEFPTVDQGQRDEVSATRAAVLVWGATSSVGSNAVQMAAAAGYDVIAAASRANFETVRRLGARVVIDYRGSGEEVVKQVREALVRGGHLVGIFDAIGAKNSIGPILKIFEADLPIQAVKRVHTTGDGVDDDWKLTLPKGVEVLPIQAIDIRGEEGDDRAETVGWKIYRDFLPRALAAGKYESYPEPAVAGEGLGSIQAALETSKKGRGGKVVVTIE